MVEESRGPEMRVCGGVDGGSGPPRAGYGFGAWVGWRRAEGGKDTATWGEMLGICADLTS
ncbi:hypothetical protein EJ06DRAFT_532867 [Trichodelitschia bisporula]|uniref:Uncharacterized protein n=1 Tax=Trichodelitschia bisporula TaxID=703511 RepID=A0A6G1HPU2_9PEZI|nr:hypothetical protein EJ06DRAFT_532867 [Trichodelitschia bisporula]